MYTLIAGDTAPTVFVLKDSTGTPVNITGYSFVFKLGYPTPVTRSGAIVDAVNGKLQFPWQAGDLKAGVVSAEILITTPDTKERTQKLGAINILPRIA
jgi:hypothetical protein